MELDLLARAYAATGAVIDDVADGDLDRRTPCASWTVRVLLDHVIGNTARFPAALQGADPVGGEVPTWEDDPASAYAAGRASVVAAFADPAAATRMVAMPFGAVPARAFLWIATTDTFVHAWDLAVALGRPTDLDPELAQRCLDWSSQHITGALRGADGTAPFGPEVAAPPGATPADQLAAFLGRSR